ncbi:MAG TPA: heavy metal transporter, partial [Bacillota bacterium]
QISQKDVDQVNNSSSSGGITGGAGCCAASAQATRFYGGRIPTDDLHIAKIKDGVQEVSITVNDQGYAPAAVVLQRGVKARLVFIPEKLNSCNYAVYFPEYQAQLDMSKGQTETPLIDVTRDFTFQCWMGMLHGYVKVVDDLNNVNLTEIKKEIDAYRPAGGGGGCCGGGGGY